MHFVQCTASIVHCTTSRNKPMPPKKSEKLNRNSVIKTAISYADKHGVDAVNVRQVARELNVGAMTLYTYIDNKADLLAGMVDMVAAEIETPAPLTPWKEAITTIAKSTRRTIGKHPWVGPFWANAPGDAKMDHQEAILRIFRQAGFSVADSCKGYHAVTLHAVGFALQAMHYPTQPNSLKAAAGEFLENADHQRYPFFVEHVQYHFDFPDAGGEFEFVLDAILNSLAALLKE